MNDMRVYDRAQPDRLLDAHIPSNDTDGMVVDGFFYPWADAQRRYVLFSVTHPSTLSHLGDLLMSKGISLQGASGWCPTHRVVGSSVCVYLRSMEHVSVIDKMSAREAKLLRFAYTLDDWIGDRRPTWSRSGEEWLCEKAEGISYARMRKNRSFSR